MQRFHLIANSKSGRGAGGTLAEVAARLCAELGVEFVHHDISEPGQLFEKARQAVEAAEADGGVVAAAGGDGTIRSVAHVVRGRKVRFAVIPCGTFNFFARNHNLPEDNETALRLAIEAKNLKPVRLAEVNGETFLINASLGVYAKAIRDREQATSRWGRFRLVVILSTIASFFRRKTDVLNVHLVTEKVATQIITPTIFIGNNALQLRDLSLRVAHCMKRDLLAVVTMRPLTPWRLVKLVFRGLARTLEHEENLNSFCVDSLTIHTIRPRLLVALDGEIFTMNAPFEVRALPGAVNLIVPPPTDEAPVEGR